jgi:hypothetical protein
VPTFPECVALSKDALCRVSGTRWRGSLLSVVLCRVRYSAKDMTLDILHVSCNESNTAPVPGWACGRRRVDHEPDDIDGDLVEHLLRHGGAAMATIRTRKRHPRVFVATLLMAPSRPLASSPRTSSLLFKTPRRGWFCQLLSWVPTRSCFY